VRDLFDLLPFVASGPYFLIARLTQAARLRLLFSCLQAFRALASLC
jgi:hypothetical protein